MRPADELHMPGSRAVWTICRSVCRSAQVHINFEDLWKIGHRITDSRLEHMGYILYHTGNSMPVCTIHGMLEHHSHHPRWYGTRTSERALVEP